MNLVYSSTTYHVIEYPEHDGFELINKVERRETFLTGVTAQKFRASIRQVFEDSPTEDSVDGFISNFDALMLQRVYTH